MASTSEADRKAHDRKGEDVKASKTKRGFLLLTRHSDEEITDYLQRNAEDGWSLRCVKGNRFLFERRPYDGRRVCAYTFLSRDPDSPTETQLRCELPILRKQGWDTICIGGSENIADTKRHAFLREEHPETNPNAPIPKADSSVAERSRGRGFRKALGNLVLCLVYVSCLAFVLSSDLLRVVSNDLYFVFTLLLTLALAGCTVLSVMAFVSRIRVLVRKDDGAEIANGGYRFLDHAARATAFMLALMVAFLVFDTVWGNRSSVGTRTQIGGENVVLYSDEVPITLEDLGADASGAYRSTRHTESSGFLASYEYSYDQSLGNESGGLSFIAYTVYDVPNALLRRMVTHQTMSYDGRIDTAMAQNLGVDMVFVSRSGKQALVSKGSRTVAIRSGFELTPEALELFSSLL